MTTEVKPMQNLLFFNYDLLQERMESNISLEEQYVRAYIAYRAGNGIPGKQCFASIETIAKDLGYSKNTARKHIRFLVAAKHIIELGYRSEYGTKQYTLNQNFEDWITITADFRNAYNNIEGIKTDKRKAKSNKSDAETFFNPLSEVQNLNPNYLKDNYYNEPENSNFEFQGYESFDDFSCSTEVIEAPSASHLVPESYQPQPQPQPIPFGIQIIEEEPIDFSAFGDFGGSSANFGGGVKATSNESTMFPTPSPMPLPSPFGTNTPNGQNEDSTAQNTGTWDDDFDAVETATEEMPEDNFFLSNTEKELVESAISEELQPLEPIKEITPEQCDKASKLSPELRKRALEALGSDAVPYLDYPYHLLKLIREKKEEKEKEEREAKYQAWLQSQQQQQQEEPAIVPSTDEDDGWEVIDEPNPNGPPIELTLAVEAELEAKATQPIIANCPPPSELPDVEPMRGIPIDDPAEIMFYLEESNVFYDNDNRRYELYLKEEIIDRFLPIFAERMKAVENAAPFDKFIEFCMIYTSYSLGWETGVYDKTKLKKAIEPWIPSAFQGEKYKHFTKEQLCDPLFRKDVEWCAEMTYNDIMLRHEEMCIEAEKAGMDVDAYYAWQKKENARIANEIGQKDDNLIEPEDDF